MAEMSLEPLSPGERLTPDQLDAIVKLERTGGSVSLIAVIFIFIAYSAIPRVRNVQNTFIVFASVSNVGASIASIIALDGVNAGRGTALCQAQSFMFEMFMQSDPWWSLAMAINVFLVFYFRASPDSFRHWWWLYCAVCYGGPFVIALALLLVRYPGRGPVYGEATIWCWVDREWDSVRIYTYYMLVWICIVGSIICYFLVGYHVFQSRNHLRSLTASKSRDEPQFITTRMDLPRVPQDGFYGTVVTEVQVVHSPAQAISDLPTPKKAHLSRPSGHVSFEDPTPDSQTTSSNYYSTVTSTPQTDTAPLSPLAKIAMVTSSAASKFVVDDPIKRAYLRTSLLFALSVLVTWIPSSMNRIHGWIDGESPFPFHIAAAAVLPLQGLWNAIIFFITSWGNIRRGLTGKPNRENDTTDLSLEGGGGLANHRDHRRCDLHTEDGDSDTIGSDVELRPVAKAPARSS